MKVLQNGECGTVEAPSKCVPPAAGTEDIEDPTLRHKGVS